MSATNNTENFQLSAADVAADQTRAPVDKAVRELSDLYNALSKFPCDGKAHLFFAPPAERRVRRETREGIAKLYCAMCPAEQACRTAGRTGREHGIWGGENDEERAAAGYTPLFPHRKEIARAGERAKTG